MIVIKVELWPCGDESKKQDLGTARITNTVAATLATQGEEGEYLVELLKGARYSAMPGQVWKRTTVAGFPRRRLGPWDLLYRALLKLVAYRNRGAA